MTSGDFYKKLDDLRGNLLTLQTDWYFAHGELEEKVERMLKVLKIYAEEEKLNPHMGTSANDCLFEIGEEDV